MWVERSRGEGWNGRWLGICVCLTRETPDERDEIFVDVLKTCVSSAKFFDLNPTDEEEVNNIKLSLYSNLAQVKTCIFLSSA